MSRHPIVILSALPAGGKSTLARELCEQYEKGVHIETDALRHLVVKGFVPPRPLNEEAHHQAQIMRQNACAIALNYQVNGFFVVIDEVLADPAPYLHYLHNHLVVTVFIKPELEHCLKRNAERVNKDPETRLELDAFIKDFYGETEQEDFTRRWDVVIDNTGLHASETQEKIMQCIQQKYPASL
ncbi:AAA family ATPase [Ktedonobacter robiniae]|uniref:Phosphotransferase n=1 Tax=Ktedonobacter robiniae TaxID=2778365 RepID=A0ABQ3UX22_9CHLR|nr:AAA family ATPase [Ktedonobacter robiniae]GHO57256.1 hypothetical protein KSB_57310 [Ktedonobacter robiniae]